jgi:hypothetical protein
VTQTTATLNGKVNPNGVAVTGCRFEYGTTSAYETTVPCNVEPGSGSEPVAVSAPATGLVPNDTIHFRVVAVNEVGTEYGDDHTFVTAESLPEIGRCVSAPAEKGVHHGRYNNGECNALNESGTGPNEWLPGAALTHFTVSGGPAALETVGRARVSCSGFTGSGEYTSSKTEMLHVTFKGCEAANAKCQSEGAAAGEIAVAPLEGEVGFVKRPEGVVPSVGLDFKPVAGEPGFTTFECGAPLIGPDSVHGSVVGTTLAIEKMVVKRALKFAQTKGRQKPEAFEGAAPDVLFASLAGKAFEQAGIDAEDSVTSEEPLEIKASP